MNSATNLLAYFPNYLSDGALFTKMATLGAPWTTEIGQDMDDAYFTMYSGIKNPSEFVTLHLNPGTEIANSLMIARIIYRIYGDNWTKLWEAFKTKYSPIDNYNLQETVATTRSSDRTINRTNDLTSIVDGTETRTTENDGTHSVTGSTSEDLTKTSNGTSSLEHGEKIVHDENGFVDGSTTNEVISDSNGTSSLEHGEQIQRSSEADTYTYGFNSQEKVPTGVVIETGSDIHSGTDTTITTDHSISDTNGTSKTGTTLTATDTHSGTDTTTTTEHSTSETSGTSKTDTTDHATETLDSVTKDTRADKVIEDTLDTNEGKEDIQRTRRGNIGQNSYQELLRQEFELWRWNFFTQVFEDVDKFLVLSVYSSCANH